MAIATITRCFFSQVKASIDNIKKIRAATGAPMGQCQKALQDCNNDYESALAWLKERDLMTAAGKIDK